MLASPLALPALTTHQTVLAAVGGGQPSSQVQLADTAIVDFPSLQITCLPAGAQRFQYSVVQKDTGNPTARLRRVAQALFGLVLNIQPGIALGLNFVRVGTFRAETASGFVVSLLDRAAVRRLEESGRQIRGGGIRFAFDQESWKASVSIEPHAVIERQLVVNANFEVLNPTAEQLTDLLGPSDELHESLSGMLGALVEETSNAAAR